MTNWVVIIQQEGRGKDCAFSCEGVFSIYKTAFGHVMDHINRLRELYDEEEDIFEISAPYHIMNGEGVGINVMHKKFSSWDQPNINRYYILEAPGEEDSINSRRQKRVRNETD